MSHYDYVKLPNGMKRKIFGLEDIESVQAEWGDYIEKNWITPQRKMFDPESRVKFMLEGLANIILRPDMSGLLTEYQKMKIEKYEIPISACSSILDDEMYSKYVKKDNGEEQSKLEDYMEETARRFDEAKTAKLKNQLVKKKKVFPPTRRQKIEAVRKAYGITQFQFVRVDTKNDFYFGGNYYHIPETCTAYAPKITKDGEEIYDMDQILCAETADGSVRFFDMNIEQIDGVELVGEQIKFFEY